VNGSKFIKVQTFMQFSVIQHYNLVLKSGIEVRRYNSVHYAAVSGTAKTYRDTGSHQTGLVIGFRVRLSLGSG